MGGGVRMLKKYVVFALFLSAVALPRLFGATVSCLVIETGRATAGAKSPYSVTWENSLMDVFFDTGHIVSNAPMIRLDMKPAESFPGQAERDYLEARENGTDYFLIALIDGTGDVSLRLFGTKSRDLIKEQVYRYNKPKSAKEEHDSIIKTIGLIAAQIK